MILKIFHKIKGLIKEFFPEHHKDNLKYGLKKYQIYPQGKYFIKSLKDNTHEMLNKSNFSLNNNILSVGTCFAEEFSNFLKKKSKSYKILEENIFNFVINWGRVYTVSNLKQLIQYSFNDEFPIFIRHGIKGYFDPIRDYSCGSFETKKDLEKNIKIHRKLSKKVLMNTNFIFITLGQTEAWIDKSDNFTWGAAPVWCNDFHSINRENYIQKNFTLEEIIKDLNYVINELKANNNKIKIFLTLSPVPSQSTFFKNNVILTSSTGKAKLRLAIENILDNYQDVYYISSYENVVYDNKNYKVDNRHVKRNKVGHIFSTFKNY